MNIGEAAAATGVSAKMVRHYEQIGLLPPAARTEAGYRQYSGQDLEALRFIRQSRNLGFSTEQIAALLALRSDTGRKSRAVKALAQAHLQELDTKLQELQRMRSAMQTLLNACAGDDTPACGILDALGRQNPVAAASTPCHAQRTGLEASHQRADAARDPPRHSRRGPGHRVPRSRA